MIRTNISKHTEYSQSISFPIRKEHTLIQSLNFLSSKFPKSFSQTEIIQHLKGTNLYETIQHRQLFTEVLIVRLSIRELFLELGNVIGELLVFVFQVDDVVVLATQNL